MFIPFKIKKETIDATCRIGRYAFDTSSMLAAVKANVNADRIKQAMIDGTLLQEEWFPSESYDSLFDVFISHAHADDYAVRQLAGYLHDVFGLRCFIDSVYWGYVDDLQKDLDEWYSKVVRHGHDCYDYKTSNFMAANVHIMLSMALMKMMDACECLMFVDSDNSLKYQKGQTTTPSPWIYEEMGFAKRLRVNIPDRHKKAFKISINESRGQSSISLICFSSTELRKANFTYNVDMRDFAELKIGDFVSANGKQRFDALDYWYKKYDAQEKTLRRLVE